LEKTVLGRFEAATVLEGVSSFGHLIVSTIVVHNDRS